MFACGPCCSMAVTLAIDTRKDCSINYDSEVGHVKYKVQQTHTNAHLSQ